MNKPGFIMEFPTDENCVEGIWLEGLQTLYAWNFF